MHVLFVSAYGAWGRPASYIKSQSDSLKKSGIKVTDYYLKGRGFWGYITSYLEFKKFLSLNKDYDIIHAHFGYTALIVYLVEFNSKFLISFMGDDLYGILRSNSKQTLKGRFNILMARFLQSKADWIIVKSRRMFDLISPEYKKITSVLPNGVDFDKFPLMNQEAAKCILGLKPQNKYVLFLGNIQEKRKNFKLVEDAFNLINNQNVRLINPYPVMGEDIYLYLNACDVLVLSSTLEGSPNVIKEALICNCPIVSTDVGDVKERIDGLDGCYLTGFNAEEMACAILKSLAFNARTNGRELSCYLNTDNIAQRLISIYNGALSKETQIVA